MSCDYRKGNTCEYCMEKTCKGNIQLLESVYGESCPNYYFGCPLAAKFDRQKEDYENWRSEFAKGNVDGKGNVIHRDSGSSESAVSSIVSGMTGDTIMSTVIRWAILLVVLVFADLFAFKCLEPLNIKSEFLQDYLQLVIVVGIPALFVAAFKYIEWKAFVVPAYFIAYGVISIIASSSNIGFLTVLTKVMPIIGLVVVGLAGAIPGMLTYLASKFLTGLLHFNGADIVVMLVSIVVFSIAFGVLYARLFDKIKYGK